MACTQDMFARRMRTLAQEFDSCGPIFVALGDEKRQHIILTLLEFHKGMRVGELAEQVHLSRPAISHHLKILKDAGMICVHKEGTMNFYYMNGDKAQWAQLTSFVAHVDEIVREAADSWKANCTG